MNRPRQVQQTLWEIEQRFGAGRLTTAAALRGAYIPTGFPALDALLEGRGIAAGHMTGLVGIPTSGATSLLYHLIAQAQGEDRVAAYVDIPMTLDAEAAAACGVNLERLLLVWPADRERGLNMALDLVRVDQAALIALHWSGGDGRALDRLRANVGRTRTALVVLLSQLERGDLFHTLLHLEWKGWLMTDNHVIEGYRVGVRVRRDGGHERADAAELTIRLTGTAP